MCCISLNMHFLQSLLNSKTLHNKNTKIFAFHTFSLKYCLPPCMKCLSCPRRLLHKNCAHLIASHCTAAIDFLMFSLSCNIIYRSPSRIYIVAISLHLILPFCFPIEGVLTIILCMSRSLSWSDLRQYLCL